MEGVYINVWSDYPEGETDPDVQKLWRRADIVLNDKIVASGLAKIVIGVTSPMQAEGEAVTRARLAFDKQVEIRRG